jgi:hypothetical protein
VLFRRLAAAALALAAFCLIASLAKAAQSSGVDALRTAFANPPDDSRIMMRWWWFGPAVTDDELARELRVMRAAGIGGVEIQTVYPLNLDDPAKHFRNLPYLSADYLHAVHFVAQTAKQLGLRVDLTLASGWPYGGADVPVNEAAGRLRCQQVTITPGITSVPVPALENGERLLAVFLTPGNQRLANIENGRVQIPSGLNGTHNALFFISSRTGQQVKRAAVGAEGFVLDHYDHAAIDHYLAHTGTRLLSAFEPGAPYAIFSDSLEVFGSDWTGDFLSQFRRRRGYDLTPYLPALTEDIGEQTRSIRHDWGETLTDLAEANYLTPLREWAHAHHTLFRSQTYGVPPVILSSNALVDLPEGEGAHWRKFAPARWAASASHLYGRPVTSAETWTWIHPPPFRATPLDLKQEADRMFLQGINQLVGHGWPYSPAFAGEPGWAFYASGALNDHNPWFEVMPDLARYLQRMSFLLRQGKPANDVALYLPTDDAWAGFSLGKDSVDRAMDGLLGPQIIPQILDAGFNFDFIDDRAIASAGIPYRVLVLPGVERMPVVTAEKLRDYVAHGGIVLATRRLPSLAPGFLDQKTGTPRIRELMHDLFETSNPHARLISADNDLSAALKSELAPDFAVANSQSAIGFVHRKLPSADVYFVANVSNEPVDTTAKVRVHRVGVEWWDPFTGKATPAGRGGHIQLHLEPYESRVLVFSKEIKPPPPFVIISDVTEIDISTDWRVTFPPLHRTIHMAILHSWTKDEETRYYSGTAIYEKTITGMVLRRGEYIDLSFGQGMPVTPGPEPQGTQAWLESPVREVAVVYVNGKEAGTVWHPPYRLDITELLHAGSNDLRIVVGNLAINEMAGHAPPDYRLLNLRYGRRFSPEGGRISEPLPSGLLGPITLREQ